MSRGESGRSKLSDFGPSTFRRLDRLLSPVGPSTFASTQVYDQHF